MDNFTKVLLLRLSIEKKKICFFYSIRFTLKKRRKTKEKKKKRRKNNAMYPQGYPHGVDNIRRIGSWCLADKYKKESIL